MPSIGYVVLHYINLEDTVSCVESIKRSHGNGMTHIAVVDNASPNQTGETLREKYENDPEVSVIISCQNLGFANGLNLGISCLRERGVSFYVLLNNDTELNGENWDTVIVEKYNKYHFGVIGPDIVSPDGNRHDNPSAKQDISLRGLRRMIRRKKIDYLLNWTNILPLYVGTKNLIKALLRYNPSKVRPLSTTEDTNGVQLQGSCLILSPLYMEHFDGLYTKTFLYFEEAILRYRCEKKGLPCMFVPELRLIHKGGASTKESVNTQRKRALFYLKHSLNSVTQFYNDRTEGRC